MRERGLVVRSQEVLIDVDLAELLGVGHDDLRVVVAEALGDDDAGTYGFRLERCEEGPSRRARRGSCPCGRCELRPWALTKSGAEMFLPGGRIETGYPALRVVRGA